MSSAYGHSCTVSVQGRLYCWGKGSDGRLGLGGEESKPVPTAVDADIDWKQVSTGVKHTCAIKTNGRLYCWGDGEFGQLGLSELHWWANDGDALRMRLHAPYGRPTPAIVSLDTEWAQVDARGYHTCAVSVGGELYCWGINHYGQLGLTDADGRRIPTTVGSNFNRRKFNRRKSGNIFIPTKVGNDTDWKQVSVYGYYTCAVKVSGKLHCWGSIDFGNLEPAGDGGRHDPAPAGADWKQVSAGYFHICAVKTSGRLYCWGRGDEGRLG